MINFFWPKLRSCRTAHTIWVTVCIDKQVIGNYICTSPKESCDFAAEYERVCTLLHSVTEQLYHPAGAIYWVSI